MSTHAVHSYDLGGEVSLQTGLMHLNTRMCQGSALASNSGSSPVCARVSTG